MTEPRPGKPRGLSGRVLLWLLALLLASLGLGHRAQAANPDIHRFDQAQQWLSDFQPAPDDPLARATLSVLPRPDDARWSPVQLPVVQPRTVGPNAAEPLRVRWYLLRLPRPAGPLPPWALYIPRLSGGAVVVARWSQQQWRLVSDGRDQWREQWNRPIWVELSAPPPEETELALVVGIVHRVGLGHRMSAPRVGDRDALSWSLGWRRLAQGIAPQVGSLSFLSLGLFAFLYWLGRRHERAYLWFALSSLAWWVRNLHYYVDMPPDERLLTWFWWATNCSLSWVMALVYLFALRFDPRQTPWLGRGLLLFVVGVSVLSMPGVLEPSLLLVHMVNSGVALLVLGWMTVLAWRGGGREFRVITAALWIGELLGMHDLLLVAGRLTPESVYLLPFATFVLLLSFLYAVQRRYAQAIDDVALANQRLEVRLAEREAELRANHERLRAVERDQALLLERQRLVRDMHDGLGSTLMSSLVLVEQGRLDGPALARLLRECVDDLRLVIDSLEPIGHDLVTLLASLRHRLGKRLQAAGLDLSWEVQDLPTLDWLHPPDALHVLRIMQEVLTNILKHAQAGQVRIGTQCVDDSVEVWVVDNGRGFDPAAASLGRGLRHLQQRTQRLDGHLSIDSQPGLGTTVRLRLPVERKNRA